MTLSCLEFWCATIASDVWIHVCLGAQFTNAKNVVFNYWADNRQHQGQGAGKQVQTHASLAVLLLRQKGMEKGQTGNG